ncbi:DUF2207 domain-containing protein [Parelusimicrobium proximum]|uniref:DUF2207 domain-containing protein n=1 Tax=Parelusimicrobium proximum TaxID=3228953 RepID=UPI003D180A67
MKKLFTLILFTLLFIPSFAQRERIYEFSSHMTVSADSSAVITERITLYADHQEIRRGIYRVLPRTFQDNKIKGYMNYTVLSLKRNGLAEPYFTEREGNNLAVGFGNDNYLDRGIHTYELTYKIDKAVGFFEDSDEIYWNVTGNDWDFIIDKADFSLTLPAGAEVITDGISVYTGGKKHRGKDASFDSARLYFYTTAPVYKGQGFTVAVPFKKGIVTPPPAAAQIKGAVMANLEIFIFPIMTLLFCAVLYALWVAFGRDKKHAVVIAQYEPIQGINAPMTSYIMNMGSDGSDRILSLYILEMAMKGCVVIEKKGSSFTLFPTGKHEEYLTAKEQEVYKGLFPSESPLKLGGYKPQLGRIAGETAKYYAQAGKKYFSENKHIFMLSLLFIWIFMVTGGVMGSITNREMPAAMSVFISIFYMAFMVPAVLLASSTAAAFEQKDKAKTITSFIIFMVIAGFITAHSSAFLTIGIKNAFATLSYIVNLLILTFAAGCFKHAIKQYTKEGSDTEAYLLGFKLYMQTGEGGRVAASNPEEGADVFCNYLPYAIALGVENQWSKHFASQINTQDGERTLERRGIGGFYRRGSMSASMATAMLMSGLSSSVSSATTAPSKSGSDGRGGGGRGSSGGGRGGGGGRGR